MEGGGEGGLGTLQAGGHSAQRIAPHLHGLEQCTWSTARKNMPF
jgi:hypothetical protein